MKFLWCLLFLALVPPACIKAPSQSTSDVGTYNGEYGKAGTADSESCYVGDVGTNFRCAEVPKSDTQAIQYLHMACAQYKGKAFSVACTTDGLQGNCVGLHKAPGVIVRYYGKWDKVDAQIDCGETFDGIYDSASFSGN